MEIIRDLEHIDHPWPSPVVTIGNFDGVHLGHREIFRRLTAEAQRIGGTSVVFTFVPHPRKLLDPKRAPRQINTYAEKERLIAASCVDVLICAPFTREMAGYSAERFVEEILVGRIGVRRLIVGYDYAFGKGREGNIDFLRRKGAQVGFEVEVLSPLSQKGDVYSSTRIRELILQGRMEEVVPYLGRHFTLEGEVIHGAKRGKRLGFPTANLATEKELLPPPGVYAVKVKYREKIIDGVANIGCNPTFGPGKLSLEVHLLDFDGEIYGESLRLYFLARLRDEKTFPAIDDLIAAIEEDIRQARRILSGAKIMEYRDYLDCGYR
jgi:riboflavin kinase / FMN adenylyltransferase